MPDPQGYRARLDEWTCVYDGPSDTEGVSKRHSGVSRGFRDFYAAASYARVAVNFFDEHGVQNPVAYVVHGPTSTTRCPYEVTDACGGYSVELRLIPATTHEEEI